MTSSRYTFTVSALHLHFRSSRFAHKAHLSRHLPREHHGRRNIHLHGTLRKLHRTRAWHSGLLPHNRQHRSAGGTPRARLPPAEGFRSGHDVILGPAHVHCSCEYPGRSFAGIVVIWFFLSQGMALNLSKKGSFYFRFDTATREGERIYCFETNIKFDYRDKRDGQAPDLQKSLRPGNID